VAAFLELANDPPVVACSVKIQNRSGVERYPRGHSPRRGIEIRATTSLLGQASLRVRISPAHRASNTAPTVFIYRPLLATFTPEYTNLHGLGTVSVNILANKPNI
jgi:hypothetical protein